MANINVIFSDNLKKYMEIRKENAERNQKFTFSISTEDSKVKALIVPTNEELAIARETEALCK